MATFVPQETPHKWPSKLGQFTRRAAMMTVVMFPVVVLVMVTSTITFRQFRRSEEVLLFLIFPFGGSRPFQRLQVPPTFRRLRGRRSHWRRRWWWGRRRRLTTLWQTSPEVVLTGRNGQRRLGWQIGRVFREMHLGFRRTAVAEMGYLTSVGVVGVGERGEGSGEGGL